MPNAHASSSKDASKSKSHKEHREHKEKSKHKHHDKDKKSEKSKSAPFEHRLSRMRLSVPPKYAGDWLAGVREVLNEMLMRWVLPRSSLTCTGCMDISDARYVPQMEGVLLAHWEHEFLDDTVKIIDECPYGVCEVQFRSVVWAPKIGQKLCKSRSTPAPCPDLPGRALTADGTHSLSSPSHLSLLFARTFNISIPLQHIPQDLYKFEHADQEDMSDDDSDSESDDGIVEEVGRWRNVESGQLVGEEGKKGIKFTVIGYVSSHLIPTTLYSSSTSRSRALTAACKSTTKS